MNDKAHGVSQLLASLRHIRPEVKGSKAATCHGRVWIGSPFIFAVPLSTIMGYSV
jgi:hypothetical protein